MQLQYDTHDAVPEDLRESFTEFKDGDKTVFIHKDLAEAKKEAFRFKGDLTQTQRKQQEAVERLQQLEEAEQKRQKELEDKELESKKKNGQHEEILEHFKTQAEKEKAELKAQLEELTNNVRNEKKASVVNDLATLGTETTRPALKRLIDLDLTFSDDNSLIVMLDGKATSLTVEEYKAKLPELYPALVGESHGKGGQSKGATSGSGSSKTKKFNEYNGQELVALKREDPNLYNILRNEYYNQ